jgi:flagellar biogenesis protein FliO
MTQPSPAPRQNPDDDRGSAPNRIAALLGLVLIVLLVVAAVYLVQALRRESRLEDCLMSGRTNCMPIAVPSR